MTGSPHSLAVSSEPPGTTHKVIGEQRIIDHTWSPGSRYLAFASTNEIGVLDVRTGLTLALAHTSGHSLAWEPKGKRLTFVSGRGSIEGHSYESGFS